VQILFLQGLITSVKFNFIKSNPVKASPDSLKNYHMKKLLAPLFFLMTAGLHAQDSTMNSLTLDMESKKEEKNPVQIFSSERAINANTTELIGKGRMQFVVTHNFEDIGGTNGGIKNFFGLDNTADVRIGFEIGLGKNLDVIAARSKGSVIGNLQRFFELGVKYRFLQQTEDNSTPLSLALFINDVVSTTDASPIITDENHFTEFSDRNSQVIQLIAAKKIGKVSIQLNPTLLHQGYAIPNDQENIFALGGVVRFPVGRSVNMLLDWMHPFRNQTSKDSLLKNRSWDFADPLGIGIEILTAGHVFTLKFCNNKEILENRFLARTISHWGDGQFRWCFTISRRFVLWRESE
jgi:hypothetical protein